MKYDASRYDDHYAELRAAGKSGWTDEDSPNFAVHLSDLREILAASWCPDSGRALDAGCGAGNWSFVLADMGFDVTGVDFSLIAIKWALLKSEQRPAEAPGSVAFVHHNATDLEFLGAGYFDFVLDGFLLHSLIGEDRQAYLCQVRHILKPDGIFMVQSFCAEDLTATDWEGWNIDPATRLQHDENGVVMKYIGNREGLLAELRETGFDVLQHKISPICGGMLVAACRPLHPIL